MPYRRAMISFVDILGFSELVRQRSEKEIEKILAALHDVSKHSKLEKETFDLKYIHFSDCFVRVIDLQSRKNIKFPVGWLFHELMDLLHMQLAMVYAGIFLRGAVTVGDIKVGAGTVFGPGLITAYRLESELAVYPRIIVDPALLREYEDTPILKAAHHDHATDKSYVRELLRRDTEGVWYIDYLNSSSEFDEFTDYLGFLDRHKEVIIREAKLQQTALNRVTVKLNWLAHYHNQCVVALPNRAFTDNDTNKEVYIISQDDFPLIYDLR